MQPLPPARHLRPGRVDPLDLFQTEGQQINLAGPTLGLGTQSGQLRLCGAILRPQSAVPGKRFEDGGAGETIQELPLSVGTR